MLPNNPNPATRATPTGANSVEYQTTQLSRTLQNVNTTFAQFMANLSTQMESVVQPTLGIKSGAYSAFGNNFLTRGALGVMDSIMDTTEGLFTPKEEKEAAKKEAEKNSNPMLAAMQEQTKILSELHAAFKDKVNSGSMNSGDIDNCGEGFEELLEVVKGFPEKFKCDDKETNEKLDKLVESMTTMTDIIKSHGKKIDDGFDRIIPFLEELTGKKESPTLLLVDLSKKQLNELENISSILLTHTKILERTFDGGSVPKQEDVFRTKRQIDDDGITDVEAKPGSEKFFTRKPIEQTKSDALDISDVEAKPSKTKILSKTTSKDLVVRKDQKKGLLDTVSKLLLSVMNMIKKATSGMSKMFPVMKNGLVGNAKKLLSVGNASKLSKNLPSLLGKFAPKTVLKSGLALVAGLTANELIDKQSNGPNKPNKVEPSEVETLEKSDKGSSLLGDIATAVGSAVLANKLPKAGKVLGGIGKGLLKGARFLPTIGRTLVKGRAAIAATAIGGAVAMMRPKSTEESSPHDALTETENKPQQETESKGNIFGDVASVATAELIGKGLLKSTKFLPTIGKGLLKIAKFLPMVGTAITAVDTALGAVEGVSESGKIFGYRKDIIVTRCFCWYWWGN